MSLLSYICSLLFGINIVIGLYILFRDWKSPLNRVYFFMSLCMTLWFLPSIHLFSTTDTGIARECVRIASVGIILFVPAMLHFSLLVKNETNSPLYFLLYVPLLIIAAINLREPIFFSRIYLEKGIWHFIPNFHSAVHAIYSILAVGYALCSILFLLRTRSKVKTNRKRKQLLVVGLWLLIWVGVITTEEIILPALIMDFTYGLAPITFTVAMVGMGYAILRYRFMEFSVSPLWFDMMNNIDEAVIVLNSALGVEVINRKALELLCSEEKDVKGKNFISLIPEGEETAGHIREILKGERPSYNGMFYFNTPSSRNLMAATFSPIKDDLEDTVSVLVIARKTGKSKFREKYRISDREMTVILQILAGLTNSEIATKLHISELTVKSHIGSIYNKLDLANRVQLLKLLKQYNILP